MSQKVKTEKNQIKVSFGKPKYFINETKRTVTCVLEYDLQVPVPSNYWQIPCYVTFAGMNGTVRGIARCSEDDKFNEKIGMEIASSRAEQNAYLKCAKFLQGQWENHLVYASMMDKFIEKAKGVVIHNEAYIERMGKSAENASQDSVE